MSTITTQSINVIFNISSVNIDLLTDVRFNVVKHREFITYKTLSDIDSVNLAYVYNKQLISDDNIYASDRANDLADNRLPQETDILIFTGISVEIPTDRFIVTDQFFTSDSGQQIPIFYQHILSNFDHTDPDQSLSDIVILDGSLKNITVPVMSLDYTNGIVYNNIINTFDFKSGDYNLFYIRYTVKNSFTGAINSYLEIINNQFIYRAATFDDLLSDGTLPPTLKVYITEDNISHTAFEITMPVIKTYALLESSDSRIHLIKPSNLGSADPWFATITNGNFFTSLPITTTTTGIFKFNLPEFNSQVFTPFAPYKFQNTETSQFINNHSIKTLKKNIQFDLTNGFHIFIVARNVDGTARIACSTNTGVIGNPFEDITITSGIRSFDGLNGIIDLSVNITESDTLEASYYYEEKEYEILDIDFNPIFNADIIGERIVFYLVPNTTSSRFQCLYFLIVNKAGIILSTSQPDNADLLTDIETNTFTYDIPSVDSGHLNFIDKYTLQVVSAYTFANATNPKYLIVSECTTADIESAKDSVVIDVRKEGGGIKDTPGLLQSLAISTPELQWGTSNAPASGFEYPGNSTTLIEIPTYMQKDYGGNFDDTQLRAIVEKHIAFGTYPILRGYSSNVMCSVEPISDMSDVVTLKVTWRSYGADKKYNVYYSIYEDKLFTLANTSPITDNLSGNTYTISDSSLLAATSYWVYVVPCDTIQNYPQTIIGVDKTHTFEVVNKVNIMTYVFPS